jgi:hypothetical protein
MTLPGTLTILAAAANGLLAGLSLEVALVKRPDRPGRVRGVRARSGSR